MYTYCLCMVHMCSLDVNIAFVSIALTLFLKQGLSLDVELSDWLH